MGQEVQVSSKQVEGSQHTGIAEIVSSEASFIPQLFFNSEMGQKGNIRGVGGSRFSPGGPQAPKPSLHLFLCPDPSLHSLALPRDPCDPSISEPILKTKSFLGYLLFSRPWALEMEGWAHRAFNSLSPGLPFPRFPHLMSWLYLARRSERHGAPVLI